MLSVLIVLCKIKETIVSSPSFDDIMLLTKGKKVFNLVEVNALELKLKEANSKLASIELILDEYYNGGYTTIGELVGEISYVLNGEDDD